MSVSVLFSEPLPKYSPAEIRASLEAVDCRTFDRWEVIFSVGKDAGEWSMAISGPDFHRRVYRLREGETGHFEPRYLAAVLQFEIHAFPSCPPFASAFAVAELALRKIPYDDTDAFRGRIEVDGATVSTERLMELHRRGRLNPESIRAVSDTRPPGR